MNYTLNINEQQAKVISNALDLYMRIGMGQLTEILQHPTIMAARDVKDIPAVEANLRQVKSLIFKDLPKGVYHSVLSEKIDDSNRVAYDLCQIVRNRLAWDRLTVANLENLNQTGSKPFGVWFDDPYQTSTTTELASIAVDCDAVEYTLQDISDEDAKIEIVEYLNQQRNKEQFKDTVADALKLPLRQVCKIVDSLGL
jgi:hypothetical protein